MVIWLIGMSASGKTTIGRKLHDQLTLSSEKWVFLDGDVFRHILGEDLGHSLQDRRKNAYRISKFCEFLNFQGVNVLACVLSIFHDNQEYNKINIPDYKEVFIDVDFDELIKRDNKELYKKALQGDIKNVVGVDIEFKSPFSPDLIIDNNANNPNFEEITEKIIKELNINLDRKYKYTKNSLLENPHKYEYSKFEGHQFFIRYEKDRKDSINFLEKRQSNLNSVMKLEKLQYSNHLVDNHIILKDFLIYLWQNNNELKSQKDIILILIKRFEVGKKLYLAYDLEEIRKTSLEYKNYINYALFSLVLQKYYERESVKEVKLIYLNVILKVNDILSSIKQDIIRPVEIKYSIKAFQQELDIVRGLT
jgi:cytidine diphosphoramidate kinase